jgi:hypothetical protein
MSELFQVLLLLIFEELISRTFVIGKLLLELPDELDLAL